MKNLLISIICSLASLQGMAQIPSSYDLAPLKIIEIDPGEISIGMNTFSIEVLNTSDSAKNLYLSLRVVGMRGWQRGDYYTIMPGAKKVIRSDYMVDDPTCHTFIVYLGLPKETIITKQGRDPRIELFNNQVEWSQFETFRQTLNYPVHKTSFWTNEFRPSMDKKYEALRHSLNQQNKQYRDTLFAKLNLEREGYGNFGLRKLKEITTLDDILVDIFELEGEADKPIGFLWMQQEDLKPPYKTILFLTGNPPGKKEPYVKRLQLLARAGYRVAIMDRRESARKTEVGEFWHNTADPVFDAMHLVDHLMKLPETDTSNGIAIIGFSKGSAESQLVAALHEDVRCAVLSCRMIDNDELFKSWAWWPTLYIPGLIVEMGADSILTKPWQEQLDFMTPEVLKVVKQKFKEQYGFYDSKRILKLIAPKPLLLVTGAYDSQFPLQGVMSLDQEIVAYYRKHKVLPAYNFYIMPRNGHSLNFTSLGLIINYLDVWFK